MKRLLSLFGCWCLLVSCSALPRVYPIGDAGMVGRLPDCRYPYPAGRWQYVHAIEAAFPGGHESLLMGATIISTDDRSARCILMTVEGLVLFDAQFDQEIVINRAVHPFDSATFARGLISDIRLLFFAPLDLPVEAGRLQGGAVVCRYPLPDGGFLDSLTLNGRQRELRRYDSHRRLIRSVAARFRFDQSNANPDEPPDRLELKAHDPAGYSLVLKLVEAIKLDH